MANWNNLVAIRVRKMFFPEQTTETKMFEWHLFAKNLLQPIKKSPVEGING